jgi:ketosteroid isomerase-like protein
LQHGAFILARPILIPYEGICLMNRREAFIAGFAGLAAAVTAPGNANAETSDAEGENPELEPLRALLGAYDQAFANQNLEGVMATLSGDAVIMGNGPGEIWSGPDEIKAAHRHFFEGFDVGEQSFDYEFSLGHINGDTGWLLTSGNVNGTKDGKDYSFPVNISLVATKNGENWVISAMHFSNFGDVEEEG